MKRVIYLLCALCLLAVPAFAQEATPEATPEMGMMGGYTVNAPTEFAATDSLAFVYFVHAAADVGPVDIYTTAQPDTPLVANLSFGEVTEETWVPAAVDLVARAAGSDPASEPITQLNFDLGGNTSWIISLVGLNSNASVLLEPVSVLRTDYNDMARVRVMNLVANDETLSLMSESDVDFGTGLGFNGMADNDIEPGTYNLTLGGADGTAMDESQQYSFDANTTTTLLIMGALDGSQPIRVIPVSSERFTSRVQFVNNGAEPVDIFMRPGDMAVVSGLESGATSDFVELPSGAVTFITYAPGTGPTGQELAAAAIQLDPARDVVVTFDESREGQVSDLTLTPRDNMDMSASG